MADFPEGPIPPIGPPRPEDIVDPFEARRDKIYARIAVIRNVMGVELSEETIAALDQLHTEAESAVHGDKNALTRVENRLEELEDAMDSGELFFD